MSPEVRFYEVSIGSFTDCFNQVAASTLEC